MFEHKKSQKIGFSEFFLENYIGICKVWAANAGHLRGINHESMEERDGLLTLDSVCLESRAESDLCLGVFYSSGVALLKPTVCYSFCWTLYICISFLCLFIFMSIALCLRVVRMYRPNSRESHIWRKFPNLTFTLILTFGHYVFTK